MIAGIVLAMVYAGDFVVLEIRIIGARNHSITVQVESYSAVPEKNNRVEFFYNDPDTEECVHALFPHSGDNPCWYVNRHRVNRTIT